MAWFRWLWCTASVSAHFHHEADSPGVGFFPGRRLASVHEPRRLQVAPLYGSINDFAYYFIDVLIGTPPRRQSVILDSGSSLLGFSCTGCGRNCGHHLDEPFDISMSRTAERYSCYDRRCMARGSCRTTDDDTCLYSQVYSEGSSIEGFFFSDKIAIGDQVDHNSFVTYDYIGCHTRETVLFTTQQASGILGVSFPKGGRQPTVMDTLMNSREVNSKIFSLCAAEDGGLLSVGGYNTSYHKPSFSRAVAQDNAVGGWFRQFLRGNSASPPQIGRTSEGATSDVVWVRMLSDSAYSIDLARILIGDKTVVQGGFGDVLVDSGTTYSYFPNDIYHSLSRELVRLCKFNNEEALAAKRAGQCIKGKSDLVCYHFPDDGVAIQNYLRRIPSFFVEFGNGGIIEWAAESWLFRKSDRVWCSAIENNRRKQTILGMSFMKMKEVIFDRDNSYIGFVSANCPPHNAYNRPDPPQQESAYIGGDLDPFLRTGGGTSRDDPQAMNQLPPSMVNDTGLWNWTGDKAMPYLNANEQLYSSTNAGSFHDISRVSWIVGGGVGMFVVGAMIALVAKSTRRSAYDPVLGPARWETGEATLGDTATAVSPVAPGHRPFPNFEDLERASELL